LREGQRGTSQSACHEGEDEDERRGSSLGSHTWNNEAAVKRVAWPSMSSAWGSADSRGRVR
jgi:hypothetical protein